MTMAESNTMADALAEWFAVQDQTQELKSAGQMADECANAVLEDEDELALGVVPSAPTRLECDETWLDDASPRFGECSPIPLPARSIHPAFPEPLLEPSDATATYIDVVMHALEAVMKDEPQISPGDPGYEHFANEPVRVPLRTYIQRIVKLARTEPSCIILAGSFLGRLAAFGDGVTISDNNVRRLTFVAVMLASKFLHDIPYTNKFWARISGTYSLAEVNQMELDMLHLLDFDLNMSREAFEMFTGIACTAEI